MSVGFTEIRNKAITFAYENKNKVYEMGESQTFWNEFFEVFGISRKRVANFEQSVRKVTGTKGRIDVFWPGTLLIEQKSLGEDLTKAYTQAKDYFPGITDDELPKYILVCDFNRFHLHNVMRGSSEEFSLNELPNKVELFGFMIGRTFEKLSDNEKVSIQASERMAKLYDSLKDIGYPKEDLKQYLVRLLFCLFADDTGIFDKGIFHELVSNSQEDGQNLADILRGLFERLNTPQEERLKIEDRFSDFPYVNGSLFKERLKTAAFNENMRKTLLDACAFDWGHITPSIFGSMFQAAMREIDRRTLGAHYTEENNILKVINPLFMNELRKEFELVKSNIKKLRSFHNKLSELKFLDPACGTGNFLIVSYREVRRLEIEVIEVLKSKNKNISIDDIVDVSHNSLIQVKQFYGLEIDPLAVEIAKVGMYLIDHQCNMELSAKFGKYYARLPLEAPAVIKEANALSVDWFNELETERVDYILGNPPFHGARMMNKAQKEDIIRTVIRLEGKEIKGSGNVDYVAGWYYKACNVMSKYPQIKTAFVSTNSITQGEQTAIVWKSIIEDYDMTIDFCYRTFNWSSQAKGTAAVHCVIVGYSHKSLSNNKVIFDGDLDIQAENINGYLVNAPNVFIQKRSTPLCDVPYMQSGNMPLDGGNFILKTQEEYEEFILKEPLSKKYIRQYMGAYEFINNTKRYCLWLMNCPPDELRKMKLVMKRVQKVKEFRENSSSKPTRVHAITPSLFRDKNIPCGNYIVVPVTSSERRSYIPIGFFTPDIISNTDLRVIDNATLYDFGILTSNIHMAWVRAVCGRLESRYRYSKDIVYNNFPWPTPTITQRETIEKLAQGILDTRSLYPNETLATLYNPFTMPPELAKAHKELDKAVSRAYSNKGFATEALRLADLMERYRKLVENKR